MFHFKVSNHYNQSLQGTVKIVQEEKSQPGILKVIEGCLSGRKKKTGRGSGNRFKSPTEEYDWACGVCFFQSKKKSTVVKHVKKRVCEKNMEREEGKKRKIREYNKKYYLERKVERLAMPVSSATSTSCELSFPSSPGLHENAYTGSHPNANIDDCESSNDELMVESSEEDISVSESTGISCDERVSYARDPCRLIGFNTLDEKNIFGEEKEFYLYKISKNPLHNDHWLEKEAFLRHRWCPDRSLLIASTSDYPPLSLSNQYSLFRRRRPF